MKIYIKTFGCKVNQSEESSFLSEAIIRGHSFCESEDFADIVLVNTCYVTSMAAKKCYQYMRSIKARKPNIILAATGCLIEYENQNYNKKIIDIAITNAGKRNIFDYIDNKEDSLVPINSETEIDNLKIDVSSSFRTRVFLKIQDGCDEHCTYCIIPKLRGKPRSKPIENIIQEIEFNVESGAKEIVLVGIHIGKYGIDFIDSNKSSFTNLIESIIKIDGDFRVRISSLDSYEIDNNLISLMKNNSHRICSHLHIPIQSGSNYILKKMARRYTKEEFIKKCQYIKSQIPDITIGTDVITGFPGETEDQFQETVETIKSSGLDFLHVFSYSEHKDAASAKLDNKVSKQVKKDRTEQLISLGNEFVQKRGLLLVGRKIRVLGEKNNTGTADNYFNVVLEDGATMKANNFYYIKVKKFIGARQLLGEML